MQKKIQDLKVIQNHFKETGFIFPSSEIYGGLANTYDYGPLGILLLKNIKNLWWEEYITKVPNNYGLDSKILLNPQVWQASGHVKKFTDPLIEDKNTRKRYRADHLISMHNKTINVEAMTHQQMEVYIKSKIKKLDNKLTNWESIKNFNLMYETFQGVVSDTKKPVYLRPELAQGIFTNFENVVRSMRAKLPFGIGQIGHSFRNEVTPGNYIFRTREFEQMELEYFVTKKDATQAYQDQIIKSFNFLELIGFQKTTLRQRSHKPNELAHYAQSTVDIEYNFPFGWGELMGIANRGDYDLKNHSQKSGVQLDALDPITNTKVIPHVIEPSFGLDRLALAILMDKLIVEKVDDSKRIVLKLNNKIAPYQVAVLPLNKKVHSAIATKIYKNLASKKGIRVTYDESGSIGRRYRRQDAIGTPLCLTIIDKTESEDKATIRFRDSMKQVEIIIANLNNYL